MSEKRDIFCPLPWVSICVQPYGPALCCSSYVDLRSHPDETPAQVFNNETMTDVRRKFLKNEWPSQCHTCERNENAGVLSLRQLTIRSGDYDDLLELKKKNDEPGLKDLFLYNFTKKPRPITEVALPIRFLELASSNYCNLKCRMCGPRYSTKWKEDVAALTQAGFGTEIETVSGYDDNPIKDFGAQTLYDLLSDEPFIMMKGGEPMLNKNNEDIIGILVKTGKISKTKIAITTNGIFLAEWFLRNLKLFKEVNITISIDASGPLNKYIRYGSYKDEDLKINMEKIRRLRPDATIIVSTAFQIYNMLNYPDLVHEYSAFCDHFAMTPAMNYQLNPQIVPDELRELAISQIKTLIKREKIPTIRQTFQDILDYLVVGKYNQDAWEHFIRFTEALDEIRSEKLSDVAPELCRFLESPHDIRKPVANGT